MTALKAPANSIAFDNEGRPILAGTTIKVVELALNHLAHGWSPEEIYLQHGRRFSLAQIYAALAYYFENQAAFDDEIDRQTAEAERMRAEAGESPFHQRMRSLGKTE